MASVLCSQVRAYLGAVSSGQHPTPDSDLWKSLLAHGVVSGTPGDTTVTPVGVHVLRELSLRAYRTDSMPLETVAQHLDRVLTDLDHVARTAEYFLAELGPVTPPEVTPLLRPVAVSLANRRGSPEELAEEFRNAWGSVEVMGGAASDRLLAAELLNASDADIESVYAPMMVTVTKVRDKFGPKAPAVSVAALLNLHLKPDGTAALSEYYTLQPSVGSHKAAALLAALAGPPATALARRNVLLKAISGGAPSPSPDAQLAASYLAAVGADPVAIAPRVAQLQAGLAKRFPQPLAASAILADVTALAPTEIVDWIDKAESLLRSRKMAPTPGELSALATIMVHDLPPDEFSTTLGSRPSHAPVISLPALTALHSWVYRPLVKLSATA